MKSLNFLELIKQLNKDQWVNDSSTIYMAKLIKPLNEIDDWMIALLFYIEKN